MDFSWPPSYLTFRDEVISFARSELNDDLVERDKEGHFDRSLWIKCAEFGIQGLAASKPYGGKFETVIFDQAMLAMEGLGFACYDTGLAFGLNAQMWTVQLPIEHFGSEEQKQRFLLPMVRGKKIGAHALTEPEAGSDIFSMQTSAQPVEGGYNLNGSKCLITFGPIADYFLIFANVKPELGKWGVSAFLVEKGAEGLEVGDVREKMGLRTVPIGHLEFKNCFVSSEQRLGAEGAGFSILNHSLEYDRGCILASQLGTMDRQLKDSIDFVRSRKQFGQSVSKFQSVSNRLADMKVRLETARLLLYKVAWLKSHNKSAMLEAAMLKLHLGESFVHSSMDAIRNRGGRGYLTEFGIERDLRDAVGGLLYAGTSDIQRNIIARFLGL